MENFIKIRLQCTLTTLLVLFLFTTGLGRTEDIKEVDKKRNQLIGYMLDKLLPAVHFSHIKMDESRSMAVFNCYLKQLDYQKRFLLSSDVAVLRSFAPHIAHDLENRTNALPTAGYDIMNQRIVQVEKMVDQIMSEGIDVNSDEVYETDSDKNDYVDLDGLRDRWRKMIKFQVISKYLDLMEGQKKAKEQSPDSELWKQAKEKVNRISKDFFFRLHQETLQDHYDRLFMAIALAFDPHTNYLPPSQRDEFAIEMRGNLEGLGGMLREENGIVKVVSIIPGSPSAKQGMLDIGDTILEVAEKGAEPVDVTDMRLVDIVRLLRGPKGTEVCLTVKKQDGAKEVIPIIRDVVQIDDTFVKHTVLDAPDGGKIGYILIPSFYRDFEKTKDGDDDRNVTDDTRKALRDLEKTKLKGLILDLRNDGGGSVVDAVDIAGLFISSGPVVQVKNSNGKIEFLNDDDANIEYSGPLVVLVNQFSASASEIVAAALQDYKRAIIVGGKHTHGKGTVQAIINLNGYIRASSAEEIGDVGALKVTVQKFYRITGDSTQYKGVEPDIVLPSLFQHLKSGEKYLFHSLPWDQIGPAPNILFSGKPINLNMIREKSLQRVKHDTGLQAIVEEAVKADERSRRTAVSLKLTTMRQKIDEDFEERNKISPQFRNYQKGLYDNKQSEAEEKSLKKDTPNWGEQVKLDPYVGEAKNIIVDMVR